MSAQSRVQANDEYDAIRVARTEVRHMVTVACPSGATAAHGSFRVPGMDLSIAELDSMFATKAAIAAWCDDCGNAVIDCPTLGKYLVSIPLASVGLEKNPQAASAA